MLRDDGFVNKMIKHGKQSTIMLHASIMVGWTTTVVSTKLLDDKTSTWFFSLLPNCLDNAFDNGFDICYRAN